MPVLFDVDDTLIDHRGAERKAALALLRRFRDRLDYPDEVFVSLWHSAAERHFAEFNAGECSYQEQRRRRIREFFGADLSDQAADARFDDYHVAYEQNWMLFPDVLPCLEGLAGEALAVISNNGTDATRQKLDTMGITSYFAEIVTSESAGISKPDPRIFWAACEQLGVSPAACLYVGDLLEKVARAAQSAGLTGVWLNRNPDYAGADPGDIRVIHDLHELGDLLALRRGGERSESR
jgi:putative hydrolase of the HAD superfamily